MAPLRAATAVCAAGRPAAAARALPVAEPSACLAAQQLSAPSRRAAMSLLAAGAIVLVQPGGAAHAAAKAGSAGDWSSPGLAAPANESQPLMPPAAAPDIVQLPTSRFRFFKTPSGVKVQVLSEGGVGPTAAPGTTVLVDYVLRRSNGYFIYGTLEGVSFQPKDVPVGPVALTLGDGSVVRGLEEALLGARPGAKLRALVPPELGYQAAPESLPQMPTFATQRQLANHRGEPLLFEVQLLRVGGQR